MSDKIETYPGTGLRESDFTDKKVLFTEWVPNARYAWDEGLAIGRYLAELKQGRLVGVRCGRCNRTVIPPRVFCEWCFGPMDEWVPLPDTGIVNTFSLCYVTWNMHPLEEPLMPAVIEIDETTAFAGGRRMRAGIMHMLGEVDPKAVAIGMRVQAVWKPADEREGSILDIRYFKPIG